MTPNIRRRVGAAIVLVLGLVAGAYSFWLDSHGWALVFATVGVCAVLLSELRTKLLWQAVSISFAIIAALGVYWVVGPNVVPDVEVIGTLQPGNDATPRNACGSTMPLLGVGGSSLLAPDALKILVGSNAYVSSSKITAIEIGRCSVLTMERTATGINVGAELYGANGQLIARIVNNEFHAISGANSRIERQNDLSTLVVKDGKGIELLYVRYLNRTTIRARGIFGCPDHQPVAFTDEGQVGASRNACFTVGRTAVHID